VPTLGGECEVHCAAGSRRMGLLCPFCGERDSFRCAEDSDKGELTPFHYRNCEGNSSYLTPLVRINFLLVFYAKFYRCFGLINKVFVVVGFVFISFSFLTRIYKGVSIRRCLLRLLAGGDGDRGGSGGRDTAD
jgi:hypothetical protein